MKASRRTFLKGVAAAPVAASIGIAVTAEVAAPVAAAAMTPAYPFRWWFSYDGGNLFSEEFSSKESAIAFLESEGGGMIAECQQQDFDLRLDADYILQCLAESNEELIGEGEFIEPNKEQTADLEKSVNDAIAAWATRHKIEMTAWTFGEVRNKIEAPKPEAAL